MLNKINSLLNGLQEIFIFGDHTENVRILLGNIVKIIKEEDISLLKKEDIDVMIRSIDFCREYIVFNVNKKETSNFIVDLLDVFSHINEKIKLDENKNIIDSKIEETLRIMSSFITLIEATTFLKQNLGRIEQLVRYNPPSIDLSHHYISTLLNGGK